MTSNRSENPLDDPEYVEREFAQLARSLGEKSTAEKLSPAPTPYWRVDPAASRTETNASEKRKRKKRFLKNSTDIPETTEKNRDFSDPRSYSLPDDESEEWNSVSTDDYPYGSPSGRPPAEKVKLPTDNWRRFALILSLGSIFLLLASYITRGIFHASTGIIASVCLAIGIGILLWRLPKNPSES